MPIDPGDHVHTMNSRPPEAFRNQPIVSRPAPVNTRGTDIVRSIVVGMVLIVAVVLLVVACVPALGGQSITDHAQRAWLLRFELIFDWVA